MTTLVVIVDTMLPAITAYMHIHNQPSFTYIKLEVLHSQKTDES